MGRKLEMIVLRSPNGTPFDSEGFRYPHAVTLRKVSRNIWNYSYRGVKAFEAKGMSDYAHTLADEFSRLESIRDFELIEFEQLMDAENNKRMKDDIHAMMDRLGYEEKNSYYGYWVKRTATL